MKTKFEKLFLFIGFLFISSSMAFGQNGDTPLSNTYYITNVNVIQKPGQMLEMGTIIVKDGIIEDVGKNLTMPANAIPVDADSMYVYAGFIDAYNNIGIKKAEKEEAPTGGRGQRGASGPQVGDPGNPPNKMAGIMPERNLATEFDKSAKSTKSWRESGFTASMSVPKGGMLPGQASVILHTSKDADASILKENVGLVGTFATANRVYPATIIGVMAKYRDIFRQAGYALKHENAYKASPVGMARPAYSESIEALYPVIEKKMPLYMEAQKLKDISRAMVLQNDLDFNMCLMNVKQGTHYMDEIKSANIPVVISLSVPHSDDKKKEEKDDKDGESDKKEMKKDDDSDESKKDKKKEKPDPEKEALQARKTASINEYQSQAATFAKNGILFSFSGLDVKEKDIKKNLKAMMEHGLTEDQVLAALTTNPAKMYGLSNIMGTIEKGKIANFFITDAPYFDDKSAMKYVFVDGHQFKLETKAKKKKGEGSGEAPVDLSGVYTYTVESPMGKQEGKLTLVKDGSSYSGTLSGDMGTMEIDDIDVSGNDVSYEMAFDAGGNEIQLNFELTIDDGDLEGTVTAGEFGSFPVKGERVGDPKF